MNEKVLKPYSQLQRMMLIINPVSGRRTSLRFLPDIIRIFTDNDYVVSVFPTGKRGDATEFARLYASEFDIVVTIGGDGTLNETLTGLILGECTTPVGYIPSGSTNDFASCHGISSDMLTAAMNIVNGTARQIDIGKFGDKYFSYVSAFGAFSWLSYTTSQNLKNVLGHSAYLIDAVKDLPKLKSYHLKFIDGGFTYEGDYIFGAVCNSTSVAGTFTLPSNMVDTSDGKFEVLLVHKPQSLIDWQSILNGVFTQDYSSYFLDLFQVDSLSIEAPSSLDWSLDGERCHGKRSIEFGILKKRITLIS